MKNYYSIILILLLFVSNLIAQNDTISLCESNKTVEKIWFDTDIMIGKKGFRPKEVDDGITFIMALKQEQIEIVGISNITHIDYGAKVLQQLLTWHAPNKNIPIYKGSPEANDLGKDNSAVLAMRDAPNFNAPAIHRTAIQSKAKSSRAAPNNQGLNGIGSSVL